MLILAQELAGSEVGFRVSASGGTQAKDRKVPATAEALSSTRAGGRTGCVVLAENLPLVGIESVEFTGLELDAAKPRSLHERFSPRAGWPVSLRPPLRYPARTRVAALAAAVHYVPRDAPRDSTCYAKRRAEFDARRRYRRRARREGTLLSTPKATRGWTRNAAGSTNEARCRLSTRDAYRRRSRRRGSTRDAPFRRGSSGGFRRATALDAVRVDEAQRTTRRFDARLFSTPSALTRLDVGF